MKQSERKGKQDCLACARAYERVAGTHVYFVRFYSASVVYKLLFDCAYYACG